MPNDRKWKSDGLQFFGQVDIGGDTEAMATSLKDLWLLLQKLCRTMIALDRSPLCGLMEVDETSMPFRTN